MSSYSLTRSARRDLDGIWDYVARDSEVQADRLIDWLTTKFENLGDNPYLGGRWRPQMPSRAFSAKKFTIFYMPVADGVEIRRIFRAGLDLDVLELD